MKDQLQHHDSSKSIKNRELKLINFCASWSSPCITQCSILENLSERLQGSIDIEKINIDDPGNDADKYNIKAVPTLCLFSEGKEIKRFIGVQQLDTLLGEINIYLKKADYND